MGVPVEPTCDVCGTMLTRAQGVGLYCPNNKCGEPGETAENNEPPPEGAFLVKVDKKSAVTVLEDATRAVSAGMANIKVKDIYGLFGDGSKRKLQGLMLHVERQADPNAKPAPTRIAKSKKHPNGVQLRLATREGVTL